MRRGSGIRRKIWVVFVLQIAAISFATVVGVYGAATVLEDVLIKRALKDEAGHYFSRLERDASAQLPDTYNMRGYLVGPDGSRTALPEELASLGPGYHRVVHDGRDDLVFISQGAPGWLFLVFRQEQVHKLAFLFGFVPLTVVLLIIYLTTWLTYRASRRALSPVIALATTVRAWDPKKPDLAALEVGRLPGDTDHDVEVLSRALHTFASRIEEFVERERNFTRDASHELRSPLTVIKVAVDVLGDEENLSDFGRRSLARIRNAGRDMEALIEAFLILARESDTGLPQEDFVVNSLVHDEVERAEPLLEGRPIQLRLVEEGSFALHASPRVLSVMLGNLIRNACNYTERGEIVVTVGADFICVRDTGVGMSADELAHAFQAFFRAGGTRRGGHGVGLTIVKRLSDRFAWPVRLDSELGVGTAATIRFPEPQPV
ncbi:MAG: HAMP domain-containing sensor histidine kinase [Tahibacter sp.]